jgi:hypothetical protein
MAYVLQHACEPFALPEDMTCNCEDLDTAGKEELIAQATDILVELTGFTYRGPCTEEFRPRGASGCWCSCSFARDCRCGALPGFTVPTPVVLDSAGDPDISVTIDGEPFDDWVLMDGSRLVRTDGRSWPACSDPSLGIDEVGSFVVEVTHGEPVNLIARNAAVEIACLFVQRNPNNPGAIPARAKQVSAQGVVMSLEEVDRMIKAKSFITPWAIRFMTIHSPTGRDHTFVYSPELDDGWVLHQTR